MSGAAPPSWATVKSLLADALELSAEKREEFLDRACEGRPALRAELAGLIGAYGGSGALDEGDSPAPGAGAFLEPRAGERVGRYRIVRLLGRGGMGAVYEASDEQLGRAVAVKLLSEGVASRSILKRFELEPRVLARLRHPGIAQIFEAGSVAGPGGERLPFFAMELIAEGAPITEYVGQRSLPMAERLALFIRVCDAVTHGHQRSVIHRDLKPANILVDASGQPKVIDFGVAHGEEAEGAGATITGEILGTLRYMSPEQLRGEEIDVRTDVYALGVVLYEVLCGKPPLPDFKGAVESIRAAGERAPQPLSRLAPGAGLGGDIETVALKAVDPERGSRYQSVAELSADLGRVLRNEPISARPHSAAYQVRMFARRHRALVGGLAAIFLTLTLGVIGTTVGLVQARIAQKASQAQIRRTQRVAEFLENTIRSADPRLLPPKTFENMEVGAHAWEVWFVPAQGWGSAGPADRGVVGVLEHAAEHLDEQFGDDPELKAQVSTLLACTLAGLSDYTLAARLLESSLEIRLRLCGPDEDAVIRTRALFGGVLAALERRSEADVQLAAALDSAGRRFGAMDPRTLTLSDLVASNMSWIPGRSDEALSRARASLAAVSAGTGPDSGPAWLRHVLLIDVLSQRGLPSERDELAAECRATMGGLERTLGPGARELAHITSTLAGVLAKDAAGFEEAESLQRRALAIDTAFYGIDSGPAYNGRTALITIELRGRRFDEAETIAREALDSAVRMVGPRSSYTYKAQARLARVLTWREKDAPEAERLAHNAADGCALEFDGDFADYHHAIWAAAVRLRGDPARAEAALRERIAARGGRAPMEGGAWVEAYQYLQLALCLRDEGRADEARAAIMTANAWADQLRDPLHPVSLNVQEVTRRLAQ